MGNENIKVSICTITYKHEKFIRDTIEGVLMQEIDFPIEFIIADDNSPDHTEEIVKEYIENHPKGHIIKYTKHAENKGMMGNFVWALNQCKGEYIALCEGDDYWTDTLKLQKQIEFLENNKDYVISFHDCEVRDKNNTVINESKLGQKGKRDLMKQEIISGTLIPTLTSVFRHIQILKDMPSGFFRVKNGDTFLFSTLAQYGKAHYHDDIKKSAYRVHSGGVWSEVGRFKKNSDSLKTYQILFKSFKTKEIKDKILRRFSFIIIDKRFKELSFNKRVDWYLKFLVWSIRLLNLRPLLSTFKRAILHAIRVKTK